MRLPLVACCALCACSTPNFETDLVPEGPPEVTLVNVASESMDEAATYCGAPKRNLIYCPETGNVDPVVDAPPLGLFVRVAFDELLNPDIEDLDPETNTGSIARTAPLTLSCAGVDVPYDGFYQPSGSHLTDPPGPALVISPTGVVPSGVSCSVGITTKVTDKSNNVVPMDERGPFDFQLAPFDIAGTNPQDMAEGLDADAVIAVGFNNVVDEGSLAGRITVEDGVGPVAVDVTIDPESSGENVLISPQAGTFDINTTYTVTVSAGILDAGGAAFMPDGGAYTFSFTTGG